MDWNALVGESLSWSEGVAGSFTAPGRQEIRVGYSDGVEGPIDVVLQGSVRVGVRISRWSVGVVGSLRALSPWMDGMEVSTPSSELGWDGENRLPWPQKVTWLEP